MHEPARLEGESVRGFGGCARNNRFLALEHSLQPARLEEMYRHVAITPEGFIQQLAVSYVTHGYWFYVVGMIPNGKEPADVDHKLIRRYRIDISKWARARRKRSGLSNVHYLRHGRFFVLLATHGLHPIFQREAEVMRDCRRAPIRFAGYSVSFRGGHAHVRIERETYLELKAWLLERSSFLTVEQICRAFRQIPFEPYAPVRRQILTIWRAVNRARRAAALDPIPVACVRLRRRIVRPFEEPASTSVLLPSSSELITGSIAAQLEQIVTHPDSAECGVQDVELHGDEPGPHPRIQRHAAREQSERCEVDRENEFATAPSSGDAPPARMTRLERE